MKLIRTKFFIVFACLVMLFSIAYIFRQPLLRSFATALIKEDPMAPADIIVVLSGGSLDRGNNAANIYRSGYAKHIVCPGGNKVRELQILNLDITESALTRMNLLKQGIPDSAIVIIEKGTSTKEEADVMLEFCQQKQIHSILLVTSRFHTRRAGQVFRQKFEDAGIKVNVQGAQCSRFDELNWWKSEDGLIALNNEWLKQIYYWLR